MNLQTVQLQFNRAQIYLLFYKPTSDDPFQNKIVAHFDGPFCHVELAFPNKCGEEPWERTVYGSSIYQDESVFFKPKTYKRDGYVSYAIEVSTAQYHKIKSYCRDQMQRKVGFSKLAMYASYLPFQIYYNSNGTFCSKHCTSALQHAGVELVATLNPNLTTPSRLYRYLMKSAPITQVVPAKLNIQNIKNCSTNLIFHIIEKNKNNTTSSPGNTS
jgi:hypothetical protein